MEKVETLIDDEPGMEHGFSTNLRFRTKIPIGVPTYTNF